MADAPRISWESRSKFEQFTNSFIAESDRGVAVLAMCVLEEMLRNALGQRLGPFRNEMLPIVAPAGRWSVLLTTSEAFGLLSAMERRDLGRLVKVRNAFAHQALQSLSFNHHDIRHLIDQLETVDEMDKTARDAEKIRSLRVKFIATVAVIYGLVAARAGVAKPLVPCKTPDFGDQDINIHIGGW